MKNTIIVVTFTPLKRNRYRCNQTGQIVKKGGVDLLRRIILSGNTSFIKKTKIFFKCPKCGKSFSSISGVLSCRKGHKVNNV